MKLSTRLSLFFLSALAAVLLGFSVALFALAWKYLDRQVDERLEAALNTLLAATESGPLGLEWEPYDRTVSFNRRMVEGSFAWQVTNARGERLDGSAADELADILAHPQDQRRKHHGRFVDARGTTWRVRYRWLKAPESSAKQAAAEPLPAGFHAELILGAAVSMEGVRSTLRNLALVLFALSCSILALALVCGRKLSEHALKPVTSMAQAARAISGEQIEERLPFPRTADEIEDLGRSINGLLDRLQDSFERQRRFTGDASHQLRTPLTAIQGQVDLALRHERTAEEYRRALAVVQRKTRHLSRIVESLLFLARADHEALEPLLEAVDLALWLTDHVRVWKESHGDANLQLEIAPEGSFAVRVQPALLAELVNNLLDNAELYSGPGSPIRVTLDGQGDAVALAVEDRGIGIAADELPHLFDPFYRSPEARRRGSPGLGLGLSIAARLARSLGGTILVSSQVGQGSRFTLRLPVDGQAMPELRTEFAVTSV
ncbi:MAG: HAMP domain-containing sensor histidine kinase [Isosphaeraceae bacterium]